MGDDIRKWPGFKDKLTYKDVLVIIVCISSLTPYIFQIFLKKKEIIIIVSRVYKRTHFQLTFFLFKKNGVK